jgi:hypothetical protein
MVLLCFDRFEGILNFAEKLFCSFAAKDQFSASKSDVVVGDFTSDVASHVWLVFLKDDTVIIYVDFKSILFGDAQCPSQFNRNDHAAKFINFTYDTSRFHRDFPLSSVCNIILFVIFRHVIFINLIIPAIPITVNYFIWLRDGIF